MCLLCLRIFAVIQLPLLVVSLGTSILYRRNSPRFGSPIYRVRAHFWLPAFVYIRYLAFVERLPKFSVHTSLFLFQTFLFVNYLYNNVCSSWATSSRKLQHSTSRNQTNCTFNLCMQNIALHMLWLVLSTLETVFGYLISLDI